MNRLHESNLRIREKLGRLGVRFTRDEPLVVSPGIRSPVTDCICSYYASQDGKPTVSLKVNWYEWLLCHEYGHYLVDKFGLGSHHFFKKHFGYACHGLHYDAKVIFLKVVDTVLRKMFKCKPPKGFVSYYALVDGEEDFCECVAFLVCGGLERPEDEKLAEKVDAAKRLLKECGGGHEACFRQAMKEKREGRRRLDD